MRPPFILVDKTGDVTVFDTAQELEQYVEPVDVLQDEFTAYDSEGRLLSLQVTHVTQGRFLKVRLPVVRVSEAEHDPSHCDDLRRALLAFLQQLGYDETASAPEPLSDLLRRVIQVVRAQE